jgi:hypothetical protein
MSSTRQRLVALLTSGIVAAGMVGATALPAGADDRGRHRDKGCTVELAKDRRTLDVTIEGDKKAWAFVLADFNKGDDGKDKLQLDRRGEGSTSFDIPRHAKKVVVKVLTKDHRDIDKCEAELKLDRGGRK